VCFSARCSARRASRASATCALRRCCQSISKSTGADECGLLSSNYKRTTIAGSRMSRAKTSCYIRHGGVIRCCLRAQASEQVCDMPWLWLRAAWCSPSRLAERAMHAGSAHR
jgi:hypothetical protein